MREVANFQRLSHKWDKGMSKETAVGDEGHAPNAEDLEGLL